MTAITNRIWFLPRSASGQWSVRLIVAMLLLFGVGMWSVEALYAEVPKPGSISADVLARPALALSMLGGMVAGVAAFVSGLVAVIRNREHSLLVYVSVVIGALLIWILAGELFTPH